MARRWCLMWPLIRRVQWCPHCRREVPDFEAHKWWAHSTIYRSKGDQ